MGFHGGAATHKPKITMHNAKCRLKWCKARRHWALEQWKCVLCVEELDWPAQSPDFNPIEQLWDERRLRARTKRPTSVPKLTNARG